MHRVFFSKMTPRITCICILPNIAKYVGVSPLPFVESLKSYAGRYTQLHFQTGLGLQILEKTSLRLPTELTLWLEADLLHFELDQIDHVRFCTIAQSAHSCCQIGRNQTRRAGFLLSGWPRTGRCTHRSCNGAGLPGAYTHQGRRCAHEHDRIGQRGIQQASFPAHLK